MTDRFVNYNSLNIYYRKYGDGKQPLVLLHGNGEEGKIFEKFAESVSDTLEGFLCL